MLYRIKEITYQDAYGPEFEKFVNKWKKQKNDDTLFVQFTNFDVGYDNRKGYESPDHSDPVGVYGYPLKYVIDHPGDIWYGAKAKYLRVLRNLHPEKTLQLQWIDYSDAKNLIYKARRKGKDISDGIFPNLEKEFKDVSRWGKIFFQTVQRKYNGKDFTIRSGKEQAEILLATGYWAIEDRPSRQSQSVINEREPLQICFLASQCFKVVDYYHLADRGKENLIVGEPSEKFIRGVAQKFLKEIFNDTIAKQNKDYEYLKSYLILKNNYFSNGGRNIKIETFDTALEARMKLGKFGHKPFKTHKKSNAWSLRITINCEKGEFVAFVSSDEPIQDVIDYMKEQIDQADIIPDWKKLSRQAYIADVEKEHDKEVEERSKQPRLKALEDFDYIYEIWEELAKKVGVILPSIQWDDTLKLEFLKTIRMMSYYMSINARDMDFDGKVIPLSELLTQEDYEKLSNLRESNYDFLEKIIIPILTKAQPYLTKYTLPHGGVVWQLIRAIEDKEEQT